MAELKREIGLLGAIFMGLGSIVGTGVFVSIGIGANVTGGSVLFAIFLASLVAICNGLSSAQLAANHPVSGGTYEYGYHWLSPSVGFIAGWTFLIAKSASAATAALGFAGYLNQICNCPSKYLVVIALAVIGLTTVITLLGIKRTTAVKHNHCAGYPLLVTCILHRRSDRFSNRFSEQLATECFFPTAKFTSGNGFDVRRVYRLRSYRNAR